MRHSRVAFACSSTANIIIHPHKVSSFTAAIRRLKHHAHTIRVRHTRVAHTMHKRCERYVTGYKAGQWGLADPKIESGQNTLPGRRGSLKPIHKESWEWE